MARRQALCLCLSLLAAPVAAGPCPPAGWSRDSLQALKASGFRLESPAERDTLALGLLECLDDPDPELRDGIAYAALSDWMRAGELSPELLRTLRDRSYLSLSQADRNGLRWPFSALVLAEIARTDRIAPWMTPAERATMVLRATTYLESVRDYRGFDPTEGWRHGIAHGADWLAQLALNPALDPHQLARIVDAVGLQAVPADAHAYVYGEPQRLAAPVLYAAQRGFRDEAGWKAWFEGLKSRLGDGALAWRDAGWLARRHDLLAFLQAVYIDADMSGDARAKVLLPGVRAALKALP